MSGLFFEWDERKDIHMMNQNLLGQVYHAWTRCQANGENFLILYFIISYVKIMWFLQYHG